MLHPTQPVLSIQDTEGFDSAIGSRLFAHYAYIHLVFHSKPKPYFPKPISLYVKTYKQMIYAQIISNNI